MNNNCPCFSCEKYTSWAKIDFLKKTKAHAKQDEDTAISHPSSAGFNRLPDDVFLHILEFISPTNIDDFITILSLEMVSQRFRHCVVDNKKIWGNVTELVIGIHPDLPDNRYLCHIGHYSLGPFLERVKKITKVIINNDLWLCADMTKNKVMPTVCRFVEKFQIREFIVDSHLIDSDFYVFKEQPLVIKLIESAKHSLETFQFKSFIYGEPKLMAIADALGKCVFFKNLKIVVQRYIWWYESKELPMEDSGDPLRLFLTPLKSVQSLEISRYDDEWCFGDVISAIRLWDSPPFQLQTLRFTNPNPCENRDQPVPTLNDLKYLLSIQNASSIRELELHHCSYKDDLTHLPHLLDGVAYLTHFKLVFMPCLVFNKTQKILEFLENVIHTKDEQMKISITFNHSDVDRDVKLAIMHSLLESFDVPQIQEHEDTREFVRGKVCVNLKIEKIVDQSLICHPTPP